MAVIVTKRGAEDERNEVSLEHPLPVSVENYVQTAKTYRSPLITIPGVAPSAAYASGDALGTKFTIPVGCTSGVIEKLVLIDQDKEQLPVDFLFFIQDFDGGTDNAAFDMTDGNAVNYAGAISVEATDYAAFNDNAAATVTDTLRFHAPAGVLYCQAVARGAQNLTAATDYAVRLTVRPD